MARVLTAALTGLIWAPTTTGAERVCGRDLPPVMKRGVTGSYLAYLWQGNKWKKLFRGMNYAPKPCCREKDVPQISEIAWADGRNLPQISGIGAKVAGYSADLPVRWR